jgi:hypothetical protein
VDKKRVINIIGIMMFIGMGLFLVQTFAQVSQHETEVKSWTPTNAVIYEVYREKSGQRVGPGKVPQLKTGIRYEYAVNNVTYKGETSMSDGNARTFNQGDKITVQFNPKNPEESNYDYVGQVQIQAE